MVLTVALCQCSWGTPSQPVSPRQLCGWPRAGGLTPGVLVFWPGGQLCSVLGVPDGNREDGRGRRPAQVAGTVSRVEGRTVCCPCPAGGEQSERDSGVPGKIPDLWLACCVTLGQSPASSEPSILTVSVYIGTSGARRLKTIECCVLLRQPGEVESAHPSSSV